MIKKIPTPISGGLILGYKCPSSCRHCVYACSPDWEDKKFPQADLELTLASLAGKLMPAPHGPTSVDLNYGLHFTGGEPFEDFELLCTAVSAASRLKIPSMFVETNGFWCTDEAIAKEKLTHLTSLGLHGIMISVNPYYLEHVPFERTELAVKTAVNVLGAGTMIYELEYFRRFKLLEIRDTVPYEEYLRMEAGADFRGAPEFFVMGRAPYALGQWLMDDYPPIEAEHFVDGPCPMPLVRTVHNHFDNYGNYVPGSCAGLSYGDCRQLNMLLDGGLDTNERPVLGLLMDEDLRGLMALALDHGYRERQGGYFSRCHLCEDIRRFLALEVGGFVELSPLEFYRRLESR